MLEVRGLSKSFGGIHAVSDCTLGLKDYAIAGLIGAFLVFDPQRFLSLETL